MHYLYTMKDLISCISLKTILFQWFPDISETCYLKRYINILLRDKEKLYDKILMLAFLCGICFGP